MLLVAVLLYILRAENTQKVTELSITVYQFGSLQLLQSDTVSHFLHVSEIPIVLLISFVCLREPDENKNSLQSINSSLPQSFLLLSLRQCLLNGQEKLPFSSGNSFL